MTIRITAPEGVPEVRPGDDLAALLLAVTDLEDGDIVVVTSKVVSKAEGRLRHGDRDDALAEETVRPVAHRGGTSIVRNRLGLTIAAAGIDASNVEPGWIALLPEDPDASARRIRAALRHRTGHNVAVLVTDTAGRPWRTGQTDIAIGAAGLVVTEDFHGRHDTYGNPLFVTLPAVADELAGAAELAAGKLSGRPFAVIRGRPDLVLPTHDDGPGASVLIREDGADLFGYGAREAVVAAVRGGDGRPFGAPVDADELAAALGRAFGVSESPVHVSVDGPDQVTVVGAARAVVAALAFAHGWGQAPAGDDNDSTIRLRFARPTT